MVSARFGFISLHGLWAKEKWVDGDAQIPMVFDGGLMVINGGWMVINGDWRCSTILAIENHHVLIAKSTNDIAIGPSPEATCAGPQGWSSIQRVVICIL